jgi:GT2 family glycosyltransferase
LSANERKLPALDLLALPIAANGGITRDAGGFHVEAPWALAEFGSLPLKAGWWRIDCKTSAPGFPELRLSAPWDPLIAVRVEEGSKARIYLREGEYQVSLLVSAWPRTVSFEKLTFRRLGPLSQAKLIAGGLTRLSRRERPWAIVTRAVRRLLAGQSMGVRSGGPFEAASSRAQAPASPAPAPAASGQRIVRQGGIAALLNTSDKLHANAFAIVAAEFARRPSLKAIYSDAEESGCITPHPEWDPELARNFPFDEAPVFLQDASETEDAMLAKLAERHGSAAIGRIALPLVRRAATSAIAFTAPETPPLVKMPRVSVVIPTKTRIDLLTLCLQGLRTRTGHDNLQIVVVDNGATDPTFPEVLKQASESFDLVKVDDFGPFNFSRLINAGVARSDGEVLLLLNDDVVAQESGWLRRMVESAMRPEIGAVGARLTYADTSIQHAGVALGLGGVCGHLWKGMSKESAAANPYVSLPGGRLAVTAACLAVRRDAFTGVGGFDEALGVALNDIDFCLKLHAKRLTNLYRGDAWLIHHESQSRGDDDATLAKRRRLMAETRIFLDRWKHLIGRDPFSSPAFDLTSESGAVHPAAWDAPERYAPVKGEAAGS